MSISEKFTIIIVTYNSEKYLSNLIDSIHKYLNNWVKDIIIIDNNSKNKNYLEKINKDKTNIFKNSENVGFSKAVNQGIDKAESEFILLLNPDTEIIDISISKIFQKIKKDENIGAIGGGIIDANGNMRLSATMKPTFLTAIFEFTNIKKIFPNNIYSRNFWVKNENEQKVFSLCGAFMLFRKHINKDCVKLDEKYFLYMEDVDLGYIFQKNLKDVLYCPNITIKHIGGASSNSKYKIELSHWYKSRKYFFTKHLGYIYGLLLNIIFSIEEFALFIYHKVKNEPSI